MCCSVLQSICLALSRAEKPRVTFYAVRSISGEKVSSVGLFPTIFLVDLSCLFKKIARFVAATVELDPGMDLF